MVVGPGGRLVDVRPGRVTVVAVVRPGRVTVVGPAVAGPLLEHVTPSGRLSGTGAATWRKLC